jgi:hypothetical protein
MAEKINLKLISVAALAVILLILIHPGFEKNLKERPLYEKLGYTPQGKFYKIALGEFRWFVGQYLAFKSIIYYGGNVENIKRGRYKNVEYYNLYRTIETAALLNPYHEDTYYFVQASFTWEIGRINEVNAILKYMMKYRTWDYKIPYFLGFNYAYFLKDYKTAAHYYKIASEISGTPLFTNLAARFFYEGGETELGISHLEAMIKITRKESVKKIYETRLEALKGVKKIEDAVKVFYKEYGRYPADINELVEKDVLNIIPVDPYGGEFYLDENKKVRTTSHFSFTMNNNIKEDESAESK